MFDISFMELLVISVVALIVIGPERLPTVARTLGHLYGRCRGFVYSVRTDIHNEMRMEELKKMQSSVHETVHGIENSVQKEIDQIKNTIESSSTGENSSTHLSPPQAYPESHQSIENSGESFNSISEKEKK